jgi:hypothetical protein
VHSVLALPAHGPAVVHSSTKQCTYTGTGSA